MLKLLEMIIAHPPHHAKWLNTLSFLENQGARLIARHEDEVNLKEMTLKHASEEFRHAHLLKTKMRLLNVPFLEGYRNEEIFGGYQARHYLRRLEALVSRRLKTLYPHQSIKRYAYPLVTYAIEKRAEELYPLYDQVLKDNKSKVRVLSIFKEEIEHLQEMEKELASLKIKDSLISEALQLEGELFHDFYQSVHNALNDSSFYNKTSHIISQKRPPFISMSSP